jgi:hypothetical protein
MENASAAFLDAVRRSMSKIRTAIGATTIDPKLLTCAEKLRYQGYLRRQDSHAAIAALVSDGVPLKEIVRRTGHSRNLVRQDVVVAHSLVEDTPTEPLIKRRMICQEDQCLFRQLSRQTYIEDATGFLFVGMTGLD